MKNLIAIAMALASAALIGEVQAQNMSQGTAQVREVHGSAKYSSGGGVWVPLRSGTVLRVGSEIQTGPDSYVDLYLGNNGPTVRVASDTTMDIEKLNYSKTAADTVIDTQLNLRSGRLLGHVKKMSAASKYEIKVPNGVAGIRGTDYEVRVTPRTDGRFDVVVTCVNGQIVAAAVVDGVTRTAVIGTGQTWSALSGQTVKIPGVVLPDLMREFGQITRYGAETGPIGGTAPTPPSETYVSPTTGFSEPQAPPVVVFPPGV